LPPYGSGASGEPGWELTWVAGRKAPRRSSSSWPDTTYRLRATAVAITVSVNDAAGNRLAEANGAASSVAPGQSATADLLGGAATGAKNCTVANVSRFPG
jgi:hypothetical protein